MITLNGKQFAEPGEKLEGHHVGTIKRFKRKVELLNRQGEKIGEINKFGVICKALKLDNGKYWYSLTTIPEIGEYESHMQMVDEINELGDREWVGNDLHFNFKKAS